MRANPPQQKPGQSKQDFSTPHEFIEAVVREFGPIAFDLAADARNCKASDPLAYFDVERDGCTQDWSRLPRGNWWLNPQFDDIARWSERCAHEVSNIVSCSHRILLLTPASVGSCWYRDHVHGSAWVLALNPRMSFDGQHPYPKDLMLSVYGAPPGFDVWCWKDDPLPNGARSWLWRASENMDDRSSMSEEGGQS